MGSHSVTFHTTQANTPRLYPSPTGWYSIYRPFKDGGLSKPRPRVQVLLSTEKVSQLMTSGGREFQGTAQLKDRLPMSVCLDGTSRNGLADVFRLLISKRFIIITNVTQPRNLSITNENNEDLETKACVLDTYTIQIVCMKVLKGT